VKFSDKLVGVVLVAFGLWVLVTARGFPRLPGQIIGPGTFPMVLGSLCALGGFAIALRGFRVSGPMVTLQDGWRRPDRVLAVLVAVGGTALFAATFEWIGFPLGCAALLSAVYFAAGLRGPRWILLSLGFALAVHLLMTRLLYVPLPAGLLRGLL
jgi:hypothetical protein